MAYYFFVAQLPTFRPGDQPPMELDQFLVLAKRYLSNMDFDKLTKALSGDPSTVKNASGVFGQWIKFNQRFRNELAVFRALRAGRDPKDYVRGERQPDIFLTQTIEEAGKANNPLDAEKILDKARLHFLDIIAQDHYFDFDVILAYALKLKLFERYKFIASDEGKAIFDTYKNFDPNQTTFSN